jgi:D-alanyl-D-alanine carboxypeptidase/D-alanyl-D-alanine-endopeptidase (penicillin-binding protein 4)
MRFLALVLFLLPLAAAARDLPGPVRESLQRSGVPLSAVGAIVLPVDGTATIAHNVDLPLNPASVIKLVTTYAGLDLLGPAYTFKTQFIAAGDITNGELKGDLVVRGGGDPKLTAERVWQVAHQLHARGLRDIRGDLVLDRGFFAPVAHDPSKFDGDVRRAYNVGPDALLVNFKTIEFRFTPVEGGVRVTGEPDLPNVTIASRLQAVKEPCGAWRRNLKHEIEEMGLLATIVFTGTYPLDCGEKAWSLAVFDQDRYAESVFRSVWVETGGKLWGKVRPGPTPAEAKLFYTHESEPLAELVRDINKFSNNVMARQLFIALSAEKIAVPGDAKVSALLVAQWLKARGITAPELVIDNGSGLSRSDRASAATIAAVLKSAWMSPVMPELMSSLPVFALDGTFRNTRSGAAGQAHIKGGTLTGVQAIAGYVLDVKGRRWIVVMMANHENANRAQPAMDALVEWVQRGGR